MWSSEKPKVLKLGVLPVKAMLAVEEHIWASSGGQVFIISTHTHCVEVGNLVRSRSTLETESSRREKDSRFVLNVDLFVVRKSAN